MKKLSCSIMLLLVTVLLCTNAMAAGWANRTVDGLYFQVPSDFKDKKGYSNAEKGRFFGENAKLSVNASKTPNTYTDEALKFRDLFGSRDGVIWNEVTINGHKMLVAEIVSSQVSNADCVLLVKNGEYAVKFIFKLKTTNTDAGWEIINEIIYRIGKPSATPTPKPKSRFQTPTPAVTKKATAKPTATPRKLNIKAGDIVTFGHYDQDNNTRNGKESIEWDVLAVQGNKALLISSRILDQQVYDFKSATNTDWSSSYLRSWMNGTFLSNAFVSSEKSAIIDSSISYLTASGLTKYNKCKIFALSKAEAQKYYPNDFDGSAKTTLKANVNGATGHTWWLRDMKSKQEAYIVLAAGGIYGFTTYQEDEGVRPAMWVDLSKANLKKVSSLRALPTMTPSPRPTNTPRPTVRATATPKPIKYTLEMVSSARMRFRYNGDSVDLGFPVVNNSPYTVKSFTLCAYALNSRFERIYPNYTYYYCEFKQQISPGQSVMTSYMTLPKRSQIHYVVCGISEVTFTNGRTHQLDWMDNAVYYYYRAN